MWCHNPTVIHSELQFFVFIEHEKGKRANSQNKPLWLNENTRSSIYSIETFWRMEPYDLDFLIISNNWNNDLRILINNCIKK